MPPRSLRGEDSPALGEVGAYPPEGFAQRVDFPLSGSGVIPLWNSGAATDQWVHFELTVTAIQTDPLPASPPPRFQVYGENEATSNVFCPMYFSLASGVPETQTREMGFRLTSFQQIRLIYAWDEPVSVGSSGWVVGLVTMRTHLMPSPVTATTGGGGSAIPVTGSVSSTIIGPLNGANGAVRVNLDNRALVTIADVDSGGSSFAEHLPVTFNNTTIAVTGAVAAAVTGVVAVSSVATPVDVVATGPIGVTNYPATSFDVRLGAVSSAVTTGSEKVPVSISSSVPVTISAPVTIDSTTRVRTDALVTNTTLNPVPAAIEGVVEVTNPATLDQPLWVTSTRPALSESTLWTSSDWAEFAALSSSLIAARSSGDGEAVARAWNKLMHMLYGNMAAFSTYAEQMSVSVPLELEVSNYYAPLSDADFRAGLDARMELMPAPIPGWWRLASGVERMLPREVPKKAERGSAAGGQSVARPKSKMERQVDAEKLSSVARRLAPSFASLDKFVAWVLGDDAPGPALVKSVGDQLARSPSWASYPLQSRTLIESLCEGETSDRTLDRLARFDPDLLILVSSPQFPDWAYHYLESSRVVREAVLAPEAAGHNKEMHATEGNRRWTWGLMEVGWRQSPQDGWVLEVTTPGVDDPDEVAMTRSVIIPLPGGIETLYDISGLLAPGEPYWDEERFPERFRRAHEVWTARVLAVEALERNALMHAQHGNIDGYGEAQALGRNKAMHSVNGNMDYPPFPQTMSDMPPATWNDVMYSETEATGRYVSGAELLGVVTGLQTGLTMTAAGPLRAALRGRFITPVGGIIPTEVVPLPLCGLWPAFVGDAGGALVANPVGPPVPKITLQSVEAVRPLAWTADSEIIREKLLRDPNARGDVTWKGFRQREFPELMAGGGMLGGDCYVAWFLKGWLYLHTTMWAESQSQLPLAGQISKLCPTRIIAAGDPVVGYDNLITPYNWECGHIPFAPCNPVFPFLEPGVRPRVSFHTSVYSIDQSKPMLVVPEALAGFTPGLNMGIGTAILLMLVSPTCGITSVQMNTTDTVGAQPAVQPFIPLANLVSVDGWLEVQFLLPTKQVVTPQDQASAQLSQLYPQFTGPVRFGQIAAASQAIQISWGIVGGIGINWYDSASLLGTWAAVGAFAPQSVLWVMQSIANLTSSWGDYAMARQQAELLAWRAPAMHCHLSGLPPAANPLAVQNFLLQDFRGRMAVHLPTGGGAALPLPAAGNDYVLPDVSFARTNLLFIGLATQRADTDDVGDFLRPEDCCPQMAVYSQMQALQFYITGQVILTHTRVPYDIWGALALGGPMTELYVYLSKFFAVRPAPGQQGIVAADLGDTFCSLHARFTGGKSARSVGGLSVWHVSTLPLGGFCPVINVAGAALGGLIPTLLADIWVQIFIRHRTLGLTTFLPAVSKQTGWQRDDARVIDNATGASVPMLVERAFPVFSFSEVPEMDEVEFVNGRLALSNPAWIMDCTNIAGVRLAGSSVDPGTLVVQKPVPADPYTGVLSPPGYAVCSTLWKADVAQDGQRVILVARNLGGGADDLSQVMAGMAPASIPVWLVRSVAGRPSRVITAGGGRSRKLPRLGARRGDPSGAGDTLVTATPDMPGDSADAPGGGAEAP